MNDRDETVRAEAIVREIASSSDENFETMRGFLRDYVDDDYFVTSFTEVEDGASMWQHYGQEGYAIVFAAAELEASVDADFIRVSYQEEEFRHVVQQDIHRHMAYEENTKPAGPSPGVRKAGFKEAEWQGEAEWRLVAHRHIRCGATEGGDPFEVAPSRLGPRPYVELGFDRSCIVQVIAGPGPYLDERVRSAGWLLRRYGLPPCVEGSQSTLRP